MNDSADFDIQVKNIYKFYGYSNLLTLINNIAIKFRDDELLRTK